MLQTNDINLIAVAPRKRVYNLHGISDIAPIIQASTVVSSSFLWSVLDHHTLECFKRYRFLPIEQGSANFLSVKGPDSKFLGFVG